MAVSDKDTFFDSLSASEGGFCEEIMTRLSNESWANPLLTAISNSGGVCKEGKSFLFELRFANALYEHGIEPKYEVPGEGNSTIDFGFAAKGQN
jgi:hypothetical protein